MGILLYYTRSHIHLLKGDYKLTTTGVLICCVAYLQHLVAGYHLIEMLLGALNKGLGFRMQGLGVGGHGIPKPYKPIEFTGFVGCLGCIGL